MSSITKINISSTKEQELIDITDKLQDLVNNNDIRNGFLIVFNPHTTAAITINEGADPAVKSDILDTLKSIIPKKNNYKHLEGNSDAHIKASLLGSSEIIFIQNKSLLLGTWQHVFFFEGDGPRNRTIYVKINSEEN